MTTSFAERYGVDNLAETAVWSTILLFIYLLYIALSPILPSPLAADGALTDYIRGKLFLLMAAYIAVQMLETILRPTSHFAVFAMDNLLALAVLMLGMVVFALHLFLAHYDLTPGQVEIMVHASVWNFIDLLIGVMGSNRIAFSGKEREETVAQA